MKFIIRTRARLLSTTCLVALWVPCAAEAQWPTKEFRVVSGEKIFDPLTGPAGQLLVDEFNASPGPLLADAFNAASEQLDEWLAAWGMEPTGARIYVADPETRQEIEDYLSEAAGLLEQWGFPEPELPVRDGKYEVVLALETPAALKGGTAAGTYHPPICGIIGGVLFYSANVILAPGAEGEWPSVTPRGRSTLAHELFHAVQANTQFLGGPTCLPGAGSWIIEGTARAVGLDVLRVLRSEEVPNWLEAWGGRDYSRPLPVPIKLGIQPKQWTAEDVAGYHTSSFWRYLAEYHAVRTVGGGWPGTDHPGTLLDYSYLAFMLEQGKASIDCQGSGAKCDRELSWLERGLQGWFGRTLREIYPRFAETLALYGNDRLLSPGFGRLWRDSAFGGCPYVELTPGAQGRVHREVIPTFERVSMQCWTVLVNEFGTDVPVEISVEGPPGSTALADLSAAVAGPPIWADTAVVQETAGGERLSVRWVVNTSPNGGNYVVLTNVARDPAATTLMQNLPIAFTALEPYARITDSPGPSGPTVTTGPGPSGADVDQPLGIELDSVPPGRLFNGATTRYPYDPSLTEPCVLGVGNLYNAQGDMLGFQLDHEGPIGPGDYTVADGRQIKYGDPLPPALVNAGFVLGFLNQPPAEQLQSFVGIAGTLTVHSVAGRFVTGTLHLTGENRRAPAIARGWEEPPANYLPGAVIRVELGLIMVDPADMAEHSGAINCLTSEPKGGKDGTATGSSGSPTDPGDDSEESSESSGSDDSEEAGGDPEESPPTPGSDAEADPSHDPDGAKRPSESDVANLGPGATRWVRVHAEGRPDLSFYGSDLDGSAGAAFSCFGTAGPANVSLYKGPSAPAAKLGLMVITTTGIAEGATGTYPIDQVVYLFGGGSLSWEGPATLELSKHDASTDPGQRRVAGRILGLSVLDWETRAPIQVDAEFDVNAACAPFGR